MAKISPRAILWTGYLLFLVYAYPGYLSNDPIEQLSQARLGSFGDWYPPVMAELWRLVEIVIPGTLGMLVLQSVAFLLGMYSILRTRISPRVAALVAVAILLFPPVMTTMAVIWKDSQMAGYLLAGIACILSARPRVRMAGIGLLWLATAMRYNALAATLPVFVLLFQWREGVSRLRRYALAVAVWAAVTATAALANGALADRAEHPWYLGALHDIAGVLHYTTPSSDSRLEKMLGPILQVHDNVAERIDERYASWSAFPLAFGDRHVFSYPKTDTELACVRRAWRKLIRHNPAAYLHHRFAISLEILGITDHEWQAVSDGYPADADILKVKGLDLAMRHSAWQAWWVHSVERIGGSILFRPYLYFFLAIVLLWPARRSPLTLALLLSGLAYEGTLFVAAVADYRYSHWLVVCTVIAYVHIIVLRYKGSGA